MKRHMSTALIYVVFASCRQQVHKRDHIIFVPVVSHNATDLGHDHDLSPRNLIFAQRKADELF